jgi:hypothetical protein
MSWLFEAALGLWFSISSIVTLAVIFTTLDKRADARKSQSKAPLDERKSTCPTCLSGVSTIVLSNDFGAIDALCVAHRAQRNRIMALEHDVLDEPRYRTVRAIRMERATRDKMTLAKMQWDKAMTMEKGL